MTNPSASRAIELISLGVNYRVPEGMFAAVSNVSFQIDAGESFGLVGESGSGKSTVLRAVAGLARDARGSILLNNREVVAKRSAAERRNVQMVFQDPYGSLHPRHTVSRILSEPAHIHGLDHVQDRVLSALTAVGLQPSHLFRFPHQLSGGQRQRIAIARALILEPSVLLLDEPTSALDVSIQAEILNLLARLRRERGITLLLVSHDLAVVAHLCDRLAVMRQGQIVEILDSATLRSGTAVHPYTQQLVQAALAKRGASQQAE